MNDGPATPDEHAESVPLTGGGRLVATGIHSIGFGRDRAPTRGEMRLDCLRLAMDSEAVPLGIGMPKADAVLETAKRFAAWVEETPDA